VRPNDDGDPPPNDNFASRQAITGASGTVDGTNIDATAETGEPAHAGNDATASVWYRYTPTKTAPLEIDTCGSDFDTVLAVYTGTALSALTPIASNDDSNDDNCGDDQSYLTFTATAGVSYSIAVDGFEADEGDVVLNWGTPPVLPANDMFANATPITGGTGRVSGDNSLATTQAGEPMHAGEPDGHSVWFRYTATKAGVVTFDTCNSNFDTVLAVYTGTSLTALTPVVANDDDCDVQSTAATAVSPGAVLQIAVAGFSTFAGKYSLHWAFTADGVPGSPTITTVATGDGWASVGWTPPVFSGTSAISSYTVEAFTSNVLVPATYVTVPGTVTDTVVAHLVDGNVYQFMVTANNASGPGVMSQWSVRATPTAGSVGVTTSYNANDSARLIANATYFGTDAPTAQQTSVGIIAYITGLVGAASPTPAAPPVLAGPSAFTTNWATADQGALVTVMRQYALTPAQAQYFCVMLVGFLLGLGGH
jgi:hypothetical protein